MAGITAVSSTEQFAAGLPTYWNSSVDGNERAGVDAPIPWRVTISIADI